MAGARHPGPQRGRRILVRARGHASIRATHGKTLEVAREPAITARATCVVGVEAEFDADTIGLLRGPVQVTLAAGGHRVSGQGVINARHEVTDRIIVRRADTAEPDTLVVRSTITASDIDHQLASALADPATDVALSFTEIADCGRSPLVLLGWHGMPQPPRRLGLLWRNADIAIDVPATGGPPIRSTGAGAAASPIIAVTLDKQIVAGTPMANCLEELGRRGARFAVVAPELRSSHPDPALTLLAAGLPVAPALWLGRVDRRAGHRPEIRTLLQSLPTVPMVLAIDPADAGALAPFSDSFPNHPVAIERRRDDVGMALCWVRAYDALRMLEGHDGKEVAVVISARESVDPHASLYTVARLLAEAGIPPRTIADALGPLGVDRRSLYNSMRAD